MLDNTSDCRTIETETIETETEILGPARGIALAMVCGSLIWAAGSLLWLWL
jgi:hypothetical protein